MHTENEYHTERLPIVDRPTQTRPERPRPDLEPVKPKIVVLGASGKIGRLVVRQLLERSSLDATIVAFVRDYDKACRVLYDDLLVGSHSTSTIGRRRRGPRLQIVHGDLVPPEDLPAGSTKATKEQEEEDLALTKKAESMAAFYGRKVSEYITVPEEGDVAVDTEALQEAIRDCTTIISCVGTVRPTNLWTDFLSRPLWRILRKDVSGWCQDPRHPFYVHYRATRKILHFAEREQLRRQAAAALVARDNTDDDGDESSKKTESTSAKTQKTLTNSRIRFIRISDLCVSQAPWRLVPVLTNILHSMVFRYQDMAERVLESSSLIETINIRPGDLVDEERDKGTVSLQVDPTGSLPCPARISRDDVAALVVAAAMFDSTVNATDKQSQKHSTTQSPKRNAFSFSNECRPFHYTLACRWASDSLDPYPAQGKMSDGHADATTALQSVMRTIRNVNEKVLTKRRRRTSHLQPSVPPVEALAAVTSRETTRKLKPYGVYVVFPVYFLIALLTRTLWSYVCPWIAGGGSTTASTVGFPWAEGLRGGLVAVFARAMVHGRLAWHAYCATTLSFASPGKWMRRTVKYISF